jgi:hypothetical protein
MRSWAAKAAEIDSVDAAVVETMTLRLGFEVARSNLGPGDSAPFEREAAVDFSDWTDRDRRFYQDLRVGSEAESDVARVAGLVYVGSKLDARLIDRSSLSPFLTGDRDAEQTTDSYAAFGEAAARTIASAAINGALIGGRPVRLAVRVTRAKSATSRRSSGNGSTG